MEINDVSVHPKSIVIIVFRVRDIFHRVILIIVLKNIISINATNYYFIYIPRSS